MASKKKIKSPVQFKSKEEVIKQLQTNQKFQSDLKFAKEVFYPALSKATTSIEDAQMFLSSINTVVMQEFLGFMKDKTFKELNIASKLDPKGEKYNDIVEFLSIFDNKNVYEAKDLIEGMKSEISLFIKEENEKRPLSSLATRWIDDK